MNSMILKSCFKDSKKPPHMEAPESYGWLHPQCTVIGRGSKICLPLTKFQFHRTNGMCKLSSPSVLTHVGTMKMWIHLQVFWQIELVLVCLFEKGHFFLCYSYEIRKTKTFLETLECLLRLLDPYFQNVSESSSAKTIINL